MCVVLVWALFGIVVQPTAIKSSFPASLLFSGGWDSHSRQTHRSLRAGERFGAMHADRRRQIAHGIFTPPAEAPKSAQQPTAWPPPSSERGAPGLPPHQSPPSTPPIGHHQLPSTSPIGHHQPWGAGSRTAPSILPRWPPLPPMIPPLPLAHHSVDLVAFLVVNNVYDFSGQEVRLYFMFDFSQKMGRFLGVSDTDASSCASNCLLSIQVASCCDSCIT